MITKILEKFTQSFLSKNSLQKYVSGCVILLSCISLSACSDQGCIEADDFGEYQTQTLQVNSNAAEDSCSYSSFLSLDDTEQGSGVKLCLAGASSAASVTDESGTTQTTSAGGCNGYQINSHGQFIDVNGLPTSDASAKIKMDASHIALCANICVQSCLSGSVSAGASTNSEPNWKATDKRDSSQNFGIQILPGAKISISAVGSVTLSNSASYSTIFMPVDGMLTDSQSATKSGLTPNYSDSNWSTESIFDVHLGQTFNTNFSGKWSRSHANDLPFVNGQADSYYYNAPDIGGSATLAPNSAANTSIYNLGRSLVAYVIPHPDGYVFDTSQTSEITGTKGTPLLPEPATWTCDYDALKVYNASDLPTTHPYLFESKCYNKANGYLNLGYLGSVDSAVAGNSLFKITNIGGPSAGLGYYGGPIRWSGDGISEASGSVFTGNYSKAFDVISSTELSIPAGSSVQSDGSLNPQVVAQKLNIPSAATGMTFTNNDSSSYMMFTTGGSTCNSSTGTPAYLYATVKDALGNVILNNIQLSLSSSGWGEPYNANSRITLEPGQKVVLTISATTACAASVNEIGVKFQKFQDITMTQSGFVRFTTLNASASSCILNGRVLNPKNADGSDSSNTSTDYYEYDDFTSLSSKDPLNSLTVPTSASTLSWSNKVFVRKGQKIRLSPISWNNTFTTTNGLTRQCGVGMVMQVIPRPALLCKGIAPEAISNPDTRCLPDVDLTSGDLIGCQAYASECSNSANTAYYCPYNACLSTITCNPGTSSNGYAKTGCIPVSQTNSAACTSALSSLQPSQRPVFISSCGDAFCSKNRYDNAQLPAQSSQAIDQCFDLESYTGRAQDIPNTRVTGALSSSDTFFNKGGKLLSAFNGSYGNFNQFTDTNSNDSYNNNRIYQGKTSLLFNKNGRLRFLFVTNNADLRKLDTNYSTKVASGADLMYSDISSTSLRGTSYTGQNGYKITFNGTLQFSNGQWLEAKLCRETSDHSCRSLDIPSTTATVDQAIDNQPHLVDLNNPSSSTDTFPRLASTANYKFDAYGTLTRTTAASAKDCSIANQGVDTAVGSTYYCHTYLNSTTSYIYDSSDSTPFSDSDYNELNKLRLIFKIKDPEMTNCVIPGTTVTSGTYNGISLPNPAYSKICYTGSNCISTGTSSYTTSCGSSGSVPCSGYISGGTCVATPSSMYNGYFASDGKTCTSNSANTGAICTASDGTPSLSSTNPCRKQYYCASVYANNSGSYAVTVKVSNPPGNNISNIIGGVITPVIETMDGKRTIASDGTVTQTVGQSQRIYTLVVQDGRYQTLLSMSLSIMIMFYGVTYLMGMTDLSSSDLINRCIKIALIYLFASPTGWYWFNMFAVKWFKDGTDYLAFMMASSFDSSTELAKAISANDYYDKSVLFSSVDKVFGMFFSQAVQKKISALLFASIFGWVYLWIIYLSFFLYIYAVGYAVLYYLTAQIFLSILFTLGPIFFIFTLFTQTAGMFNTWLNQLIGFSLQQIFLLTTLAFFNMMMYEVIKMSLGYRICWDEVWSINIITRISLLSFWTIASLPPKVNNQSAVGDIGHPEGIPSLFSILFIWVVASLMKNFITFMTNLGASIGGSLSATSLASEALKTIKGVTDYSNNRLQDLRKATIDAPMRRLDAALFDSGEDAEKQRKARKDQNRQDQSKKDSLIKAGNAAMNTYKRENAAEYSQKSESEKKEALINAKNAGMKKEANRLGIDDKKLNELVKDKGLKFEDRNLLLRAGQNMRQAMGYGGGTLNTSIADTKVDTKLGFSEAKEAMKKMDKTERDEFKKQALSGNVSIKPSMSQTIRTGGGAVMKEGLEKAFKKMVNSVNNEDYNKARDHLVKTGKISKMATFGGKEITSFARSDKEKQMINKQMMKDREEKESAMPKKNDNMTLAKLDIHSQGLDKQEVKGKPAWFGSGGLKHTITSQFEKGDLAKKYDTESVSGLTKGLATTNSNNAANETTKERLATRNEAAQKASTAIKAVNEIDAQLALGGKVQSNPILRAFSAARGKPPITPFTADEKQELQNKRTKIVGNDETGDKKIVGSDSRSQGGSGFFENKKELEKQQSIQKSSSASDQEKANASDAIQTLKNRDYYISSEGNSLENANQAYHQTNRGISNIEAQSGQLNSIATSAQDATNTFNSVLNSDKATKVESNYKALGPFARLSSDKTTQATIKDHKKLQTMKQEYSRLGSLNEKNTEKSGNTTRASKQYQDFTKKYSDIKFESVDSKAAPSDNSDGKKD